MPLRDIAVTALVLFSLPLILRKPFFGILVWTWLSLMNPHKLCWGFAWGWPFAQIVALTLFASLLISKDENKKIPWSAISITLAVFWGWLLLSTFFAFYPDLAWKQWDKVWKIMLMTFVTMTLLTTKTRIHAIAWVMMLSIGFYGVKGGIFTLTHGGSERVLGPFGTFIGGNNEIGLAMIMVVPLIRYIQLTAQNFWLKVAMGVCMGLTFVSILGTQSRGAFVGLSFMALYLFMKSRKKLLLSVFMVLTLSTAYTFMPASWHERMATIKTYQEDKSAMGRIEAWKTSIYVALDHPLVGGGFEALRDGRTYMLYLPGYKRGDKTADAHSIYFEVLVEHGFVGLFLFLALGYFGLQTCRSIVRQTREIPELFWMRDLASMLHVSMIGYAASGAFLGLALFDFYYTILGVVTGLYYLLKKYQNLLETKELHTEEAYQEAMSKITGIAPQISGIPPTRQQETKKIRVKKMV